MLTYLLRRLYREKGSSLLIIFTLSAALAINLGVLSQVKAIFFAESGIPNIQHLIHYRLGSGGNNLLFSGPAFTELDQTTQLGPLAMWNSSLDLVVSNEAGSSKVSGALVNANFFTLSGLTPFSGRFFTDQDDQPGGGQFGWPAVVGFNYWKSALAGDPNVIGRTVKVNGVQVHIVAVLPRQFIGFNPPVAVEWLLPAHFLSIVSPLQNRFLFPGDMEWEVFGQLPKDKTLAEVNAQLHTLEPQMRKAADPQNYIFSSLLGAQNQNILHAEVGSVTPSYGVDSLRRPTLFIQSIAATVLILALCTFTLIFASRAARRRYESSIRIALGATRRNLFLLDVGEALVLAVCGCLAAIPGTYFIAHKCAEVVRMTDGLQTFTGGRLDMLLMSMSFALVCIVLSFISLVTSTWQMLRSRRLGGALRTTRGKRLTNTWIIGIEICGATILLATASFAGISLTQVMQRQSGFHDDSQVVTATLGLVDTSSAKDAEQLLRDRILAKIEDTPGVLAVASMNIGPFSGDSASGQFLARSDIGQLQEGRGMWPEEVSKDYFKASGTTILQGRGFLPSDSATNGVCVISAGAVKHLRLQDHAVDKILYSGNAQVPTYECRIVGVAADAHFVSLSKAPEFIVYKLIAGGGDNLIVRASSQILASSAIQKAIHDISPTSVITSMGSLAQRETDNLRIIAILTNLALLSAALTIGVMAIGVFGVVGTVVSGSRREIGVQLALGATKSDVFQYVLKTIIPAVTWGLSVGLIISIIIGGNIATQLTIGRTLQGFSCAISIVILLFILACAVIQPLREALSVSPSECLRSE